jgi:hypothetical protein
MLPQQLGTHKGERLIALREYQEVIKRNQAASGALVNHVLCALLNGEREEEGLRLSRGPPGMMPLLLSALLSIAALTIHPLPMRRQGETVLEAGSAFLGRVKSVTRVGFGLRPTGKAFRFPRK